MSRSVKPTGLPKARRLGSAVLLAVTLLLGIVPSVTLGQNGTPDASSELGTQLPAADLPTTSEQGYTFRIESTLTAEFDSVPAEAPVYILNPTTRGEAEVAELAATLELDGEIESRADDTFTVSSANGDLFVTPSLVQYLSAAEPGEGELPADEEAIAFAREWLRRAGLLPPDVGPGQVESRIDELSRLVVLFKPVEPADLLAAYPSITVSIGPAGEVLEASLRWAEVTPAELYLLRPAEDAWRQVEGGAAYLETTLPIADFPVGAEVVGTAEYAEISLAYTTSGTPGSEQFLQPVYVFTGEFTPEGSDQTFPVSAYVAGIVNTQTPVG